MDAAILQGTGQVVRTSDFTNLHFTLDGYLLGFTSTVYYSHCSIDDFPANLSKKSAGFYCEQDWLDYWAGKKKIGEVRKFENFKPVQTGDTVVVKKLAVESPYTVFNKVITYRFGWTQTQTYINRLDYIDVPASATTSDQLIPINSFSSNFYSGNIGLKNNPVFAGQESLLAKYLARIAITINNIDNKIFSLFTDPVHTAIIADQNFDWELFTFNNPPGIEIIRQFYNNIYNFYRFAYVNIEKIKSTTGIEKLYWIIAGMDVGPLTPLSVDIKLLLINNLSNELDTFFERQKQEELCIKIALSFDATNLNTIDTFLGGLIDTVKYPKYSSGKTITLYQYTYDRMSMSLNITEGFLSLVNWVFDTEYKPTNTKGGFVKAIYALWQFSKYCPYNDDGSIKNKVIGYKVLVPGTANFTNESTAANQNCLFYYSHTAAFKRLDDPEHSGYYVYEENWPDASPMVVPYTSEKGIGIFFNNFNFQWENNKIKAYQLLPHYEEISGLGGDGMQQGALPVKSDVLYGTYQIYQPVSMLNAEPETKVPIYSIRESSINENGVTINSFIPAFVLEYIDSASDRSNAETMLGYAVDIALTFTVVGNVTKIRHLRWAATGAPTIGLFTMEGLSIVLDTITLTSQVLNYIALCVECDDSNEFCKTFKKFSNALNIACLTLNAGRLVGVPLLAIGKQCSRLISIAGGGATDAAILANLKAKMLEFNISASQALLDETVDLIKKLSNKYGVIPPIAYTYELYPVAKEIFSDITEVKIQQQLNLYKEGALIKKEFAPNAQIPKSEVPRFFAYKFEKVGDTYKYVGQQVHTEQQFVEMVHHGIEDLRFSRELTSDIILKSYRGLKQKTYSEVISQMDGYHIFTTTRNYLPFCFTDVAHFTNFKNFFQALLEKYKISKYLGEYQISGSSLTQAEAIAATPKIIADLDLVGYPTSAALRSIYMESAEVFFNNQKEIRKLIFAKGATQDAVQEFNSLKRFFTPYKTALKEGTLSDLLVPNNKLMSKQIFAFENGKIYRLSDELYKIKFNPSVKPNVSSSKVLDFNLFGKSNDGRRLLPDFTIKINQ